MIPIGPLISIGVKYILPFVVISAVLYGAYDWSYDRGYAAREAKAVKAERDILKAQQELITKRVKEEKARRELDKKHLFEVLDAKEKRNQELLDTIAAHSDKRMYVSIKRKPDSCDRQRMPGGGAAGGDVGETEQAELSTKTERDIRRYGIDVQQRINQLVTLIDFIEKSQGECLKIVD